MRVRWSEFAGKRPWIECVSVAVDGPWLRIDFADGSFRLIPDHIVRGSVDVEPTPTHVPPSPTPGS